MTPHAFDFNFVAEENELSVSENLGRPHEHAGGAQNIYEAGIHAGFINLIIRFSFVLSALPRASTSRLMSSSRVS